MSAVDPKDAAFSEALIALIPGMRAFARSLSGHWQLGDDLAQEALLKAWACRGQFVAGSNLRAWAYRIVRNQFYSTRRRGWREQPLDPDVAAETLKATSDPSKTVELDDVRRALSLLSVESREAVILVCAGGLSNEEAARICGAPCGTIRSRVSRGRQHLLAILAHGPLPRDGVEAHDAADTILAQLFALIRPAGAEVRAA
jgi:RNA polymerase sigma-70 factor (ECF subfamily)